MVSTPRTESVGVDLPINELTTPRGRVRLDAGTAIVETQMPAGSYGASIALPAPLRPLFGRDPALVRVRLRVEQGAVEVGVLNRLGTMFLDRKEVSALENRAVDVVLGIPRLDNSSSIVLMGAGDGEGRARVERIELTVHPTRTSERLTTVDLELSDFVKSGSQANLGSNVTVDTPAVAGAFVAQIAVPTGLRRFYSVVPAVIRARLRAPRGHMELGVLNGDGSSFLDRQHVMAGEERTRDVVLAIPYLGNSSDIVFMGSGSGTGRARVEALSLILHSPMPRNGVLALELPLTDITKHGSATIRQDGPVIDITTSPGTYSAHVTLPSKLRMVYPGDSALIAVRLRTLRGTAGIGVLKQDGSDFLDRKTLTPDEQVRTIYFGVDNISDAGGIIIYGGPEPSPARIQLESVSISL